MVVREAKAVILEGTVAKLAVQRSAAAGMDLDDWANLAVRSFLADPEAGVEVERAHSFMRRRVDLSCVLDLLERGDGRFRVGLPGSVCHDGRSADELPVRDLLPDLAEEGVYLMPVVVSQSVEPTVLGQVKTIGWARVPMDPEGKCLVTRPTGWLLEWRDGPMSAVAGDGALPMTCPLWHRSAPPRLVAYAHSNGVSYGIDLPTDRPRSGLWGAATVYRLVREWLGPGSHPGHALYAVA